MERIYEFWIEQAGFDGFRIDTVKHVEPGFWQEWAPAVRAFAAAHGKPDFFMFGEVLDASDALCGSFTGDEGRRGVRIGFGAGLSALFQDATGLRGAEFGHGGDRAALRGVGEL